MTGQAAASGTFLLGGDLPVSRLGYGAMRITGRGVLGPPPDRDAAVAVLRQAVELGVDLVDTADSYGPYDSEELVREALHPYDGVLVATKGGYTRHGPDLWEMVGRPEYLRQCVETSLRRLGLERIELYQLHCVGPHVALEDSLGALAELQQAGKIRHIGLSAVTVAEIERARQVVHVVSVQGLYNVGDRQSEDVLEHCEHEGIAFLPWYPMGAGKLVQPGSPLVQIAAQLHVTPAQLALAWLLRRSPSVLPIPGTGSLVHLKDNCAAAEVVLDDATNDLLTALPHLS